MFTFWRRSIWSVALWLYLGAQLVLALKPAKTYPGDPGYPDAEAWATLDSVIGGNVIQAPLPNTCTSRGRSSPIDDPVLVRTSWWAGYAGTPKDVVSRDGSCPLGNYPTHVVNVTSAEDVSIAVKFASYYNLRLVIKNTGHDFLGRNVGFGSISIWTHNLKGIRWDEAFIPAKAPRGYPPTSAIIYGAGVQWDDINYAAWEADKMVVGGASGSVGAGGGWILGGGHGPLSNRFGLGVDQVLELDVVMPSGAIATISEFSNPDLFWALRGGGGSTFAVVTRVVARAYPAESLHAVKVTVTPGQGGQDAYVRGMARLMAEMVDWLDAGVSGYPIMKPSQFESLLSAPGLSPERIDSVVAPAWKGLRSLGLDVRVSRVSSSRNRMGYGMGFPSNAGTGFSANGNGIMGTRLWGREGLRNTPVMERVLGEMFAKGYVTEPFPVLGGQVSKNKVLRTSVNPAFREAYVHFSILPGTQDKIQSVKEVEDTYMRMQREDVPLIDMLSINSSTYPNEASPFERNWQWSYWGENYPWLLDVKQRYDPNNTLWCFPCVGAEVFVLANDQKLYYAEKNQ